MTTGFWWLVATANISGVILRESFAFTSAPASSSVLHDLPRGERHRHEEWREVVECDRPAFRISPGNNPRVSVTAFTFAPLLSSSFVAATFA